MKCNAHFIIPKLLRNTDHHSYMFRVVHNSIQKIANISIMKPIILILVLNKYLDNLNYLDNRTPLIHTYNITITIISHYVLT